VPLYRCSRQEDHKRSMPKLIHRAGKLLLHWLYLSTRQWTHAAVAGIVPAMWWGQWCTLPGQAKVMVPTMTLMVKFRVL